MRSIILVSKLAARPCKAALSAGSSLNLGPALCVNLSQTPDTLPAPSNRTALRHRHGRQSFARRSDTRNAACAIAIAAVLVAFFLVGVVSFHPQRCKRRLCDLVGGCTSHWDWRRVIGRPLLLLLLRALQVVPEVGRVRRHVATLEAEQQACMH